MGNDGGTIAKGQDLRAIYATREETQDRLDHSDILAFNTCALSGLPLYDKHAEATVSDARGALFLKEKVLEHLLLRKKCPPTGVAHIRGLHDLVTLTIHRSSSGAMVCPVTGAQTLAKTSFCYLRGCGCVFSYKVLVDLRKHLRIRDDVPEAGGSECPVCAAAFVFNKDVVILNPDQAEDVAAFNDRNSQYLDSQGLTHSGRAKRRAKKDKRSEAVRPGEKATKHASSERTA